ncbi:MAG: hypothetical protein LBR36_09665 [Bacteroidales bacterium]|nr:hypothetical protein [Bacteroidales bacterium]
MLLQKDTSFVYAIEVGHTYMHAKGTWLIKNRNIYLFSIFPTDYKFEFCDTCTSHHLFVYNLTTREPDVAIADLYAKNKLIAQISYDSIYPIILPTMTDSIVFFYVYDGKYADCSLALPLQKSNISVFLPDTWTDLPLKKIHICSQNKLKSKYRYTYFAVQKSKKDSKKERKCTFIHVFKRVQ